MDHVISISFCLHWPVISDTRLPVKGPTTGSIIGAIIGVIILLAIIATAVVMFRKHRQTKSVDAPPNYKPPPPKKTGGSTEILNQREPVTEVQPLSTMYYETSGEPVTDLDACNDEENGYNVNSNHADWEDSAEHPDDDTHNDSRHMYEDPSELIDHQEHEQAVDLLSRASHGDSFVSPAMYV